ncbi:MAG: hypothetical protein SVJ22_03800 [Halobacteriota archaeon]|nr:hypothetical protein [Halobacteriota archaeon]
MTYEKPTFDMEYIKPDLEKSLKSLEVKPTPVADFGFTVATAAVAAGTWIVATTRAIGSIQYKEIEVDWDEIALKEIRGAEELKLRRGGK